MTLYMTVGIPGSGKSTYAQKLQAEIGENCVYISRDNVRLNMITDEDAYFSREDEVFEKFVSLIVDNLNQGFDVIADATHLNHAGRFKLIRNIATHNGPEHYDIVFLVMKTSLETCIERDNLREGRRHVTEPVIRNMYANYRAPWKGEFKRLKEIRYIE